jgi:hypothetical protein
MQVHLIKNQFSQFPIIPATESKCEAVLSCGAPPEAPQQALTKWEEGGKDDDGSRDHRCHILPLLWCDTG